MKPSTPSKRFHRIPPPASAVTLPQKQKLPHRRTTIAAAESHGEQFHKTNLLCIAGCDLLVQFFQQFVRIDTMHHAGFFYSFSARSRTAQTMHADRHKQRSCLRCNIQNITDNGFFCNRYQSLTPPVCISYGKVPQSCTERKPFFKSSLP